MRASIVILVAVVAVFTSSGLASASNPAQLQQTVPGVTNKVESADGGRFLREELKDESDDSRSEERGFWGDLATKTKRAVKGEYALARLFKKDYKKLKRMEISPEYLSLAAKTLEQAGWSTEKIKEFNRIVKGYTNFRYYGGPAL